MLFSLLPYHFFRGESHLLLSAYYAVPLAALLFLELLCTRTRLTGTRRRTAATVALCLVVIGSANLYYATFAVLFLAAATLIAASTERRRMALEGLLAVALITAALAVNLAPSLVYTAHHGSNHAIARTAQADETTTEAFALRLTNLVVPVPEDRIAPLRDLAASYDHAIAPGYCEACYASLGVVGTVGFGLLAIVGLGALLGAGALLGGARLLRHAAAGVAIALAVGAVGGLSSLFELLITPDIRAWNRISLFIAFFSLLAVALLLDALRARASTEPPRHGAGRARPHRRARVRRLRTDDRPVRPPPMPTRRASGTATPPSCTGSRRGCRAARASSSSPTSRSPRAIRTRRSAIRSPPTRPSTSRCAATCTPRRCAGATAPPRAGPATGAPGSPASRSELSSPRSLPRASTGIWVDPAGYHR